MPYVERLPVKSFIVLLFCLALLPACGVRSAKYAAREAARRNANSVSVVTECKNSLKNFATAVEMYSTDFDGKYPATADKLTPKYIKELPQCPTESAYKYERHGKGGYLITCTGDHSDDEIPAGFPRYHYLDGLTEGPPAKP